MIKTSIAVIGLLLIISSCGQNENAMVLNGTINGLKKGTVLLQKIEDTTLVSVDSVEIKGNSTFKLAHDIESPEMYYVYLRLENGSLVDERIPFFAENTNIILNTNLKNFGVNAEVSGSKNDSVLKIYNKIMHRYIDKNIDLIAQNFEAIRDKNDSLLTATKLQQERLISSKYLSTINFAINHKDYEVSPYLALTELNDANIKYLDTIYKVLSLKVKNSKYGSALESYIAERKKNDL